MYIPRINLFVNPAHTTAAFSRHIRIFEAAAERDPTLGEIEPCIHRKEGVDLSSNMEYCVVRKCACYCT